VGSLAAVAEYNLAEVAEHRIPVVAVNSLVEDSLGAAGILVAEAVQLARAEPSRLAALDCPRVALCRGLPLVELIWECRSH